eukprot:1928057-Rhodomonas_salina.1
MPCQHRRSICVPRVIELEETLNQTLRRRNKAKERETKGEAGAHTPVVAVALGREQPRPLATSAWPPTAAPNKGVAFWT